MDRATYWAGAVMIAAGFVAPFGLFLSLFVMDGWIARVVHFGSLMAMVSVIVWIVLDPYGVMPVYRGGH